MVGKNLREGNGWYKNASQKALVGIAEKHGWELEPGHHFTRPKRTKRPKLHDRAMAKEKHTGEAAEQTKLRDLLQQFVEEHEEDFPRWKFAHLHENLARLGIECVRVEIKPDVFGIRFSLDSKIFCKAGTVCPSLTYKNLMEKIGAKSWRNARPEVREILEKSRKRFNTSVQPHRPRVLKRLGKRQKRQFPPTPQIGITSEGVIVEHSQEVVGTDSLGQNVRPDPKFLGISSDGEPAAKTLSMGICSNGEFIPLQTAPKGLRSDGQVVQAASTGICSDGHTARNEENNEREQDSRSEPNRGHMESDKRRKRAKL